MLSSSLTSEPCAKTKAHRQPRQKAGASRRSTRAATLLPPPPASAILLHTQLPKHQAVSSSNGRQRQHLPHPCGRAAKRSASSARGSSPTARLCARASRQPPARHRCRRHSSLQPLACCSPAAAPCNRLADPRAPRRLVGLRPRPRHGHRLRAAAVPPRDLQRSASPGPGLPDPAHDVAGRHRSGAVRRRRKALRTARRQNNGRTMPKITAGGASFERSTSSGPHAPVNHLRASRPIIGAA